MKPIPAFILSYSDSSFTNPHEMVLAQDPADCRGDYTHMGAKYWGLETRRHRATTVLADEDALAYDHHAYHWVHIALRERATISELSFSTKWYTGNQVQAIAVTLRDEWTGETTQVVARTPLPPDSETRLKIEPTSATECTLKLYHEGGLSRVLFLGQPTAEQPPQQPNLLAKATISHVSNVHYGRPEMAVAGNRAEMHMSGWESARTGFGERALFTLEQPVRPTEFVVDTYLNRLNAPLTCHIFGLESAAGAQLDELVHLAPRWQLRFANDYVVKPADFQQYMQAQFFLQEPVPDPATFRIELDTPAGSPWRPLIPFGRLQPDTYHRFREFTTDGACAHLLYMHYPNGGVHGLKLFGREGATGA